MTVPYALDVSHSSTKSWIKLLCRWRGSLYKAVFPQLAVWLLAYLAISFVYRFVLPYDVQTQFDYLAVYLSKGIDSYIPLTFMLGFFVSFVIARWSSILNGIGWIDNAAMSFAAYIKGTDEETKLLRRTLVRYMVLNQALVLRDISIQVRNRFPSIETLQAAGLLTDKELVVLQDIQDHYGRYWTPLQWCYQHIVEARETGKITSDHLLGKITTEIQNFQLGLATLLKYDWVPVPLVYPQLIFLSVRAYFFICLISRQFLRSDKFDIVFPVATMIQFIVYMGWLKVGEMLLNPLGDDDDDLECNHVIDKNLITGLTLVERAEHSAPPMTKDAFWDERQIAPLYTKKTARRYVHPLIGSAAGLDLLKNEKEIIMTPHRAVLKKMTAEQKKNSTKIVEIERPMTARNDPEAQGLMLVKHHRTPTKFHPVMTKRC
uniref:Bestrophin homolog n=1 Tax=Panagrolaimus sp. JU765 TaxID=591449 RepID=A0AC34R8T0_9BILA